MLAAVTSLRAERATGAVCASGSADGGSAAAFLRESRQAAMHRDLEAALGAYAEDAMLLVPGQPPVRRLAGIRVEYEKYFREFDRVSGFNLEQVTCESGDLATQYGTTAFTEHVAETGESIQFRSHFVIVMHREQGDGWKIVAYIWNDGGPAPEASM